MARTLVLATRASRLALAQSQWVADQLAQAHSGLAVELLTVRTRGDASPDAPIPTLGEKGLFTREIEQALLDGRAHLAVHSLKDLPTESPEGLAVAAYSERQDPRDVLITRWGSGLDDLAQGAVVATSSLRRSAQLANYRPDLRFVPIRGNVDTRLRKLHEQDLDAIVVAGAGLKRLGLDDRATEWLSPATCLPAPGQGILGIQTRADDEDTVALAQAVASDVSLLCATAERGALEALGGGCRTPAGFLATVAGDELVLEGVIVHPSGRPLFRRRVSGPRASASELGARLGAQLLADGGSALLA